MSAFLTKVVPWLQWKQKGCSEEFVLVKWDMPVTWCNFCFCSPLSLKQIIDRPKSNFTALAAPPFHCTLQSRCLCAAAAGPADAFVRCTLGPRVSTLTERWVVFLSTCFLGKIWTFLPARNLSHSQRVLNLLLSSCKKIWGLFDLTQTLSLGQRGELAGRVPVKNIYLMASQRECNWLFWKYIGEHT